LAHYEPPGSDGVGGIPYYNEAVLSSTIQKKPLTVQYNYPGYRYWGRLGQTNGLGIVPKNSIFWRCASSPYKYRPLVLVKITASDGTNLTVSTSDIKKLVNLDSDLQLLVSATEYVRIWDDSAEDFMEGSNDRNRYISSIDTSTGIITLSGALSTSVQANSDYIAVGVGIEYLRDFVVVDQELDFTIVRKPKALDSDISLSAIYSGRLNTKHIAQWEDLPDSFKDQLKLHCQRIMFDTVN